MVGISTILCLNLNELSLKSTPKPGKNLATNRDERLKIAQWAILAKEPACREGIIF
jgi:hypothetical protein